MLNEGLVEPHHATFGDPVMTGELALTDAGVEELGSFRQRGKNSEAVTNTSAPAGSATRPLVAPRPAPAPAPAGGGNFQTL